MQRSRVGADARNPSISRGEEASASRGAELEKVNRGRLFTQLLLKGAAAGSIDDLSKIQFNFCLHKPDGTQIPATKNDVYSCLRAYLISPQAKIELAGDDYNKIKVNIKSIIESLHPDPTKLPNYQDTLGLRAKSFYDAAVLIVGKLDAREKSADEKEQINDNLRNLFLAFEYDIGKKKTPEELQAYYEGYMQVLQDNLQDALGPDRNCKKELEEAEKIINIKERKAQITLSGEVTLDRNSNGKISGNNISVQIDEPRNRFCDFSKSQKDAWIAVYQVNEKEGLTSKKFPEWFSKLSNIEKKTWLDKMDKVMAPDQDPHKSEVPMGPVVKKQGVPGLRNMFLSTFATINVNKDGIAEKANVMAKDVRSSNLLVLDKDGKRDISDNQKQLTKDNIRQIGEIYQNKSNKMDNSANAFNYTTENQGRIPFLLLQTLVRPVGGGDSHVDDHKRAAIEVVNIEENRKRNGDDRIFGSNHCIGVAKLAGSMGEKAMNSVNTKGMDHINKVMDEFQRDAVLPVVNLDIDLFVNQAFTDAKNGKYQGMKDIYNPDGQSEQFSAQQAKVLDRVLQATSMYSKVATSPTSFMKEEQLHLAALEEIIYQDTGNRVQSSCKSGKDREGVEKNYRNAMLAFYEKNGRLAPSGNVNDKMNHPNDRAEFVKIFIELFKTNHQARLAEFNAQGCEGQKALANILPPDILKELKKIKRIYYKSTSKTPH